MTVTRAKLAERVSQNLGVPEKEAEQLVASIFDIMKHELEHHQHVKLSGFGKFGVRDTHARRGHNPRTGEPIAIEKHRVLSFKASPVLKARIA